MDRLAYDPIYWRQLDLLPPSKIDKKIGLIGCGGIGSPTALTLIKMGFPHLKVWDFDKVEQHNLPNQIFKNQDIGTFKVDAIQKTLKEYSQGFQEVEIDKKAWKHDNTTDILISAIDSMDGRIKIWDELRRSKFKGHYIDSRMGAELMRIYAINPKNTKDVGYYKKTLYPSSEAAQLPCTSRAILYNCFVIAGMIGNLCKKIVNGQKHPKEVVFDLDTLTLIQN